MIALLNSAQKQAVTSNNQHILVLAGAGSGKTKVLVERIAYLIREKFASPMEIIAVTFTNKAAREMLSRLNNELDFPSQTMWVGTFHGLAHRFLRMHASEASLPESFQILDSDDQLRLIKRLLKELKIDDERFPPKQIQWFINNQKENGRRAQHIQPDGQYFTEVMLKMYTHYQTHCERNGLVDFTELLLRCHETLRDNPELYQHYQARFRYILVDEFQDTNTLQYAWLRLLAGHENALLAVGDDDQSIYSWRGAKIENIHRFSRDFPNAETIRLEQNYRSTESILGAANALIANNTQRLGKTLWTQDNQGQKIDYYQSYNEFEEAMFVIERIQQYQQDHSLDSIAILYRANALSRILEEALTRANLPYRIYGGQKFFSRAEIKDAIAYLRLVHLHDDDPSFERIVNMPPRGIGMTTVDKIRDFAQINSLSLWQASQKMVAEKALNGRATSALSNFHQLIADLKEQQRDADLATQTENMLAASGLFDMYKDDRSERGQAKLENLEELVSAVKEFTPEQSETMSIMDEFLAHVSLDSPDDDKSSQECVQMMTLHASKGLEFDIVFMVGVEEGIFPHHMCMDSDEQLEEERRLCYVGMTRAKQHLLISNAEQRRMNGRELFHKPSRFIKEVPPEFIHAIRAKKQGYAKSYSSNHREIEETELRLGQIVYHPKFGPGTILNAEGHGETARIQVAFDTAGTKWLVLEYANLSTDPC